MFHLFRHAVVVATLLFLTACGGGGEPEKPASPGLSSISISSANASIASGSSQRWTAIGRYGDGSTKDLSASVSWSSSNTAVATIGADAVSKGISPGAATIAASLAGLSGTATETILPAALVSIDVTPGTVEMKQGRSVQLSAVGTYTDQTKKTITDTVKWTTAAGDVISVNSAGMQGVVKGLARGSGVAVTATQGTVTGSASVSVLTQSWTSAGGIGLGREGHTATRLSNGLILIAGGSGFLGFLDRIVGLYDPDLAWDTPSSSQMLERRFRATATLLLDGSVLLVGGSDSATAELFDPVSKDWKMTGSLNIARRGHSATLLPDGRVLLVGGYAGALEANAGAEIYDPTTGLWSAAASMRMARGQHTASLLADGRVVVIGGLDFNAEPSALVSVEIYDPRTNEWTTATPLSGPRSGHTATFLPNGSILLAGGWNSERLATEALLYDPSAGRTVSAGHLSVAREDLTATPLPDGTVLVVGGLDDAYAPVAKTELYDPLTNTWTSVGDLIEGRGSHTATALPDGHVVVIGGFGTRVGTTERGDLWSVERF